MINCIQNICPKKTQTSAYYACKMTFKLAERMYTNLMRMIASREKMQKEQHEERVKRDLNLFLIYLYF